LTDSSRDDGTRIVNVEGCEYRVPKDEILAWLELYGCVNSELVEDCFKDENDTEGTNRTGSYSIKMKMDQDIPQMLPMSGRKIKIYYRGIQKLCTNCFGRHQNRNCHSRKVLWIDYVAQFIDENPDIPEEYYGKWSEIVKKTESERNPVTDSEKVYNTEGTKRERPAIKSHTVIGLVTQSTPVEVHHISGNELIKERDNPDTLVSQPSTSEEDSHPKSSNGTENPNPKNVSQPPSAKDFNIPENEEEYNLMVEGVMKWGMKASEAEAN
jgi:hypothetical protein